MLKQSSMMAILVILAIISVIISFYSLGALSPKEELTQQPTSTSTITPQHTPTPTIQYSPSLMPTLAPQTTTSPEITPTPTPTPTPTSTPTPTPTPVSTSFFAGKNWTIIDGTWNKTGNILFGSGSDETMIIADNTNQSNYAVTMNSTINAGVPNNESSIVIRYVDANNFYWMGVGCWGHQYSIGRMLNGVPTEIASYGLESDVQQGVVYTLNAIAENNVLTLTVNGTQVLQITDNSFANGSFGIRTFNSSIQVLNIQ